MSLQLTRLVLTDFRNYPSLVWSPASRVSVLFGPNGSGKTNLLEAVSLLLPGRGLRGARHAELARRGPAASGRWAVAARFDTPLGPLDVGTGTLGDAREDRRVFHLDGATPRSQTEIATRLAAVWLTPQMDRLFVEGASGRRRFLDRLTWALEPAHAREVAAHDAAVASRNRLLSEARRDAGWLESIEASIARHAVAVTAARLATVGRLNEVLAAGAAAPFPAARIELHGPVSDRLRERPALDVEDWLRAALAASRSQDAAAGSAHGAHREDVTLSDASTGLTAAGASTGQQKALLVGIVLGHAGLIARVRGFAPMLLLDEPAVHLDEDRRAALFEALARLPAQVLLTGTDKDVFFPLRGVAEGLRTGGGALVGDPAFPL